MGPAAAQELRFSRDIRPVLSDVCFRCHGPDINDRKAELRLDQSLSELKSQTGTAIVVPGVPDQSELYRRITSTDPDVRMPPPNAERQLSASQIDVIRKWISAGAKWEQHWSFVVPARPDLPPVSDRAWPIRGLDYFVMSRLDREGLAPAEMANPESLLRRLSLDLTGLPPSPDESSNFAADDRPDALDRAVDRLLSSPRFGERLAVDWLDAARYADTSGYQNDGPRYMWRWRDWVIDSLNRGLPFDQFTIEQLGGDQLPNATLNQKIATGFNRNHRGNSEGGIIPEEYAVEYVVDRVDTTMTVWQGLTIGCARCHEHKFDPISQREFYQLYAFFNSVPEFGRAIKEGNSPPYLPAPTPEDMRQLSRLDEEIRAAEQQVQHLEPRLRRALDDWASLRSNELDDWTITRELAARISFDRGIREDVTDKELVLPPDQSPAIVPDRSGSGRVAELKKGQFISVDAGEFGYFDPFSFGGWVRPDDIAAGTLFSRMTDARRGDGYYLQLEKGHLQLNFVKRWLDDALRLESVAELKAGSWHHVFVTYDGSRGSKGVRLYIDGRPVELGVKLDLLNQTFATKEPFRIGAGGGPEGRFAGQFGDVRIYRRVLSAEEVGVLGASPISEILAKEVEQRQPYELAKVRSAFLEKRAEAHIRDAHEKLNSLRREREKLLAAIPTVMVMQDTPNPRTAHVLIRGQYDRPGEPVTRGVPACLPPFPSEAPQNRLGLARWIVDRTNPLTARVIVNRYWQMLFGTGLVKTVEDFGSQGAQPTHPELLDFLALEFQSGCLGEEREGLDRENRWDIKRWFRQVCLSATYQQSSRLTPQLQARDPENRLLARGARIRLSAEVIRDQALAASGVLVGRIGGPSVRPYQPADLWKELATDSLYVPDAGEGLYRRSMYTYWKRTVSPPTMSTFDAGGRETCQVRRASTNTPLQSLALLNDITYVEAARHLATRAILEGGADWPQRIAFAMRLVLGRGPNPGEQHVLNSSFHDSRQHFIADLEGANSLISMGMSQPNREIPAPDLAAMTVVASVIVNLDEAVTKQ